MSENTGEPMSNTGNIIVFMIVGLVVVYCPVGFTVLGCAVAGLVVVGRDVLG